MTATKTWKRLLILVLLCGELVFLGVEGVGAEEQWLENFEVFCARSGDVMNLTPAELQGLLTECESYRVRIEALPESPRKVYRKRLSLTCNMVQFALQQKTASPAKE